jgi:hypothetical protein
VIARVLGVLLELSVRAIGWARAWVRGCTGDDVDDDFDRRAWRAFQRRVGGK